MAGQRKSETHTIADLLSPEPPQWGLRGDPHLWRELRESLASTPLPATEDELLALLEATYFQLVGAPISATAPTFVARLSHGGMSSGYVSPEFWRERAIPLLLARFRRSRA